MQWITVIILLILAIIQTKLVCLPLGINYGIAFLMWLFAGYRYHLTMTRPSSFSWLSKKSFYIICTVIWLLIVFIEGKTNNSYSIPRMSLGLYGLELVGAFCGIMSMEKLSIQIDRHSEAVSAFFSYLGKISLWILCVHAVDIELFFDVANHSLAVSVIHLVIDIVVAITLQRLFSYVTNWSHIN